MDTGRIKTFAIESRKILKEGVIQRIKALGFDEQGRTPSIPEKVQGGTLYQGRMIEDERFYDAWMALNEHIQKVGVRQVYEEAAYTWFNRLMAIRIMQKNHFIEPVLNYDDPEIRVPHIVSEARRGRLMSALTDDEQSRLRILLMDDNKTQEQFALLMIAYCRENKVISKCFGGIALYLELLLPDDILSQNRFIDLLNNTNDYITDEQFRSAELIGWLYQFYISERKDEVFASFKNGKKAEAEDIPAATQIFTPNWIVKYMVQNTVGRIYLDNNPYCPLKKDWKYLVEPTDSGGTPLPLRGGAGSGVSYLKIDDLADLTLADLACGSGHILVEGFDILYSLYIDEGYGRYDAIKNIFTKNLTGIDLDTRAKQLATFALLLKAAQIDPTFLDGEIMPRVYDMPNVNRYTWRDLGGHMACALQIGMEDENISKELDDCFALMEQAQNLGSIMKFNISEPTRAFLIKCIEEQARQHKFEDSFADLFHGFKIILALTEKYAALAMNPPYMGKNNMNTILLNYVKNYYSDGKDDLYSVFMVLAGNELAKNGKCGMINMHTWMFTTRFYSLRTSVVCYNNIDSLLHLGPRTFDELSGEVVQNVAFVITNQKPSNTGTYYRLVDQKSCSEKESAFLAKKEVYTQIDQNRFSEIPGSPIGYWVSNKMFALITNKHSIGEYFSFREGIHTANNEVFVHYWYEINRNLLVLDAESYDDIDDKGCWVPYNKGGEFRRWYGNNENVIAFDYKNREAMALLQGHVRPSQDLYFKEGGTWTAVSMGKFGMRFYPKGFLFDAGGQVAVGNNINSCIAYLNSVIFQYLAKLTMPTMNFKCGVIKNLPDLRCVSEEIEEYTMLCISISKQDWDAHETSWDFEENELIRMQGCCEEAGRNPHLMEDCYHCYQEEWTEKFNQLHENEEELNRQFIEIYGLEDELTPDVPLDEITILQQGEITIE